MNKELEESKLRMEKEKEAYLEDIYNGINVFEDVPEERKCSRCSEVYYYIRNKEQLLKAIDEKIKGEKPFHIEMIRMYEYSDFAGKDYYSDWGRENICGCCQKYRRVRKKGLFIRMKEKLGWN